MLWVLKRTISMVLLSTQNICFKRYMDKKIIPFMLIMFAYLDLSKHDLCQCVFFTEKGHLQSWLLPKIVIYTAPGPKFLKRFCAKLVLSSTEHEISTAHNN